MNHRTIQVPTELIHIVYMVTHTGFQITIYESSYSSYVRVLVDEEQTNFINGKNVCLLFVRMLC